MSSVAHSRVRHIDKDCLLQAAEDLNVEVQAEGQKVSVKGTRVDYEFDSKGNVDVSYWDDVKHATRQAKNLAQLSTYYTMVKRLEKCNLKANKATKDVITAVKANQKLNVEFEEDTEKVAVNA